MAKLSDEEVIEIEMLFNYPFIEKMKTDGGNCFTGFLSVCDTDYTVTVTEHPDKSFTFTLPESLTHLETSLLRSVEATNPKSILEYLNILTDKIKKERSTSVPVNRCDKYRHVIREFYELTRFYLNIKSWDTNSDLSIVKFHSVDDRNREHPLAVAVNWSCESNEIFHVASFDLPLTKDSFKASHSMRDVYEQFKGFIEKLQPFFDLMELLDERCWVLDPVPPQRSCKYRRICIGENISMILTVDPLNVTHIPDIKFLGPEKLTEKFRITLNENLENWDVNNDLVVEILHLIGLKEFPPKKVMDEGRDDLLVNSGECNICFSQRLNDKLPEVICNNDFCRNFYHIECLYEWLMSINSKRVFKELVGNCPNCEKNISCPIPN